MSASRSLKQLSIPPVSPLGWHHTNRPRGGDRCNDHIRLTLNRPFLQAVRDIIYDILGLVTSADVIRALKRDGWSEVRVKGSHHHFKHPTKPGIVTVPHPKKDIPRGTLASIERQAGIQLR